MPRISLLPLASTLLALAACSGDEQDLQAALTVDEALPSADLSTTDIEFGELELGDSASRTFTLRNGGDLPMGLASIELLEAGDMELAYSLSWDPAALDCPEGTEETDGTDGTAEAKDVAIDTGAGGSDGGGTGTGGTGTGGTGTGGGGTGGAGLAEPLVMAPGCSLPLTVSFSPTAPAEFHAGIEVLTVEQALTPEQLEAGDEPQWFRDPDNFRRVVLLHGSAVQGVGNITVQSPTVDMGHHYTGEIFTSFVYVNNVGDGDLMVEEPQICRAYDCSTYDGPHDCIQCEGDQDPCDDAFTLDTASYDGDLLPETSTLFKVRFEAEDIDPAFCYAYVNSDDPDTPAVTVDIKANVGTDPENRPPTVDIHDPPVGYLHTSAGTLTVEVDMFDINQPAETLICKIRSLRGETKIADCAADDASGHVFVDIDPDYLEDGTDTLLVIVTDQAENRAYASTTVMFKSTYPDSDDDGDGWGDDSDTDPEYVDCDDNDVDVYPGAAELPDGKDNDCDGAIDERTIGGDDDGDSVTEIDGDCDDNDALTYPGAMELPDQKDNNCNGIVDEMTSLYDDDGDGFTELDLDCDDDDASTNPAAVEYCSDSIDNNCDGRVDEAGCIATTSAPFIIGGIQMAKTAIGAGENVTMTAYVYDADGEEISFAWSEDSNLNTAGHTAISSPAAQTITWTAPPVDLLPGGEEGVGAIYTVVVTINDESGGQHWAFGEIYVTPEPIQTSIERVVTDDQALNGCGGDEGDTTAEAALVVLPLPLLLGGIAWARRRED